MNSLRLALAAGVAALALLAVAGPAEAHGRWRGGVHFSFGVPYPYYWGPRYYVAPPPVIYAPAPVYPYSPPVASQPPVYVERDEPAPAEKPTWWYWCDSARGYYPYVKECPGGFRPVPPQQ